MGDAGDFQDPFIGFPLENVQRMREIRDVYDPQGVFTRLNWGGVQARWQLKVDFKPCS